MMKNYKLLFTLLLSATMFAFSGCGKEDDNPPAPNRMELLTSGPWRISSWTVNPAFDFNQDGTPETNLFPYISNCTRDDLLIFRVDNTYVEDEGPTKCDPADPQVFTTGTWAFSTDETQLTFNPNNRSPYTETIVELTASNLTTSNVFTDSTGTYTFTSVYVH